MGAIDVPNCCELDNIMLDLYAQMVKLGIIELRIRSVNIYIYI
jgi:hypothetical protein